MPRDVVVLFKRDSMRSQEIARAFHEGIARSGDRVVLQEKIEPTRPDQILVGYGWTPFKALFEAHRKAGGHYVFLDLGFWGRKAGLMPVGGPRRGDLSSLGMHKVSVDGRHPVKGWPLNRPPDRFRAAGMPIRDWHKGEFIVIPGMSAKAAASFGYGPQEWERGIVQEIRRHTSRTIIYRSKPGDIAGRPLEGVEYCAPEADFMVLLSRAHAMVCRHSNAVVEAMLSGVQIYAEENVGAFMSMPSLSGIEGYHWPEGREQFMADTAYCQWSLGEMQDGSAWDYLKGSGLLED